MNQERGIQHERGAELLISVGLALLIFLAFRHCFAHPFIHFDDPDYVTRNLNVQSGLTAKSARWAFTTFDCGNWHPLTWLSLELDSDMSGEEPEGNLHREGPESTLNPFSFHVTNVLLHTASTLVLFLILRRMTGLMWRSAVVAALFALHPLQVESVAWVAGRKGVLSTLFWMLTLAAYLYYVRRPGVLRYLLVVLALVLGLMAKPLLVTLPFVLLLLDYWPLQRLRIADYGLQITRNPQSASCNLQPRRWLLVEKIPLFVVVAIWCFIAFHTQSQIGALPSLAKYPWDVRLWNALLAYVGYIGKMFWPMHLSAYYPHAGVAVFSASAFGAGLLLLILTVFAFRASRRWPYLAVGWPWYLGTLLPMIGLVQIGGHAMADRYVYVPLIGLFLILTWGVADLGATFRLPRPILAGAAGLALFACAILTRAQVEYWKSDLDLWQHAIAVTDNNAMAHNNLGMHYFRQRQFEHARNEFATAVALDPGDSLFHHNLGSVLRNMGRTQEAESEWRKAVELSPQESLRRFNHATILLELGRRKEAEEELRLAIDLDPGHPTLHSSLGDLLAEAGSWDQAVTEYRKAIDLDPQYADPHVGLGNVLLELGRREDAMASYRQAIDLKPEEPVPHLKLGIALQANGRLDDALAEFREAQKLGFDQAAPRIQECSRLKAFRPRLSRLLAGQEHPADNNERLAFAYLCGQPFERRFVFAAALYADAFRADPKLADQLQAGNRFKAALAAAQAGCGQGQDAAELNANERARLRRQALGWFRADLALVTEEAKKNRTLAHSALPEIVKTWNQSTGLAGVRDPALLLKLPEEERGGWIQFWHEVDALEWMLTPQEEKHGPSDW